MIKKAQMSIEFIIYIAISAISLVAVLSIYHFGSLKINSTMNLDYVDNFASIINSNLYQYKSTFTSYIPNSICKIKIAGYELKYKNKSIAIDAPVKLNNSICKNSGKIENMTMYYSNGTYFLGAS